MAYLLGDTLLKPLDLAVALGHRGGARLLPSEAHAQTRIEREGEAPCESEV